MKLAKIMFALFFFALAVAYLVVSPIIRVAAGDMPVGDDITGAAVFAAVLCAWGGWYVGTRLDTYLSK